MTTKQWLKKHAPKLTGKVVAITGATGGLGGALTEHLAALGADLILLDRNQKKSEALRNKLHSTHPDCKITRIAVDMEDFDSVKAACDSLLTQVPDFLILNAGAYHIPRHKTSIGFDNVFQINGIAPYYMAKRLHDAIAAKQGKIVAVGSIAHNYSKSDPDDIDFSARKKPSLVYGNAKRYLTYSFFEAFADSDAAAIAHPGITFTNITAHYPKIIFAIIKHPMKIIFPSTKKASLSILFALFADTPSRTWTGPRLFGIWGIPKTRTLKTASRAESAAIAERMEKIYRDLE